MQALFIDDSWFREAATFAHKTEWLHEPAKAYTTGSVVVLGLIALWVWWRARANSSVTVMAAVAWLGFGTIISVIASDVLKSVFAEERPCRALNINPVEACPGIHDYAFPSNHTAIAFAIAAGIFLVHRRWGWLALGIAALEGVSRVYLGQHYPHDVLAGAVLSCLILWGGWPLLRKPLERLIEVLARTPLKVLLGL